MAGNRVLNGTQTVAVVVSRAVVLKEATGLATEAKGHAKVAEKGHRMLVMSTLIVNRIGMTKVCARVHHTRGAQVMQCCRQLLRAKVADRVSPATVVAA